MPTQSARKLKDVVDGRPKFKTPGVGGSYFKAADDDSDPVFVSGTNQEATADDKSALKKEQTKAEAAAAKPSSSKK